MKGQSLQLKFGSAVRRQREAKGFSQESFADAIDMHRTYYSAIERGERNVTLRLMSRIADGLKLKLSELIKSADL